MTLEEAIQTLQANAELLHFEYPHLGLKEAIGVAIEALSLPSLPSDLDEAAEEYEDWAESYSQSDFPTCISFRQSFKAGAQWRDAKIPKLPDSIDEAEFEYAQSLDGIPANQEEEKMIYDAFKAGAEWMAGQYKTLGETEIYLEDDGGEAPYTQEWLDLATTEFAVPEGFKAGDKVIIQIRKR